MLLFANYKTIVVRDGEGKNAKSKAQGGRRVMYTCHHPCWDAKNRFGLASELPFEFESIAAIFGESAAAAPAAPGNPAPVSRPAVMVDDVPPPVVQPGTYSHAAADGGGLEG